MHNGIGFVGGCCVDSWARSGFDGFRRCRERVDGLDGFGYNGRRDIFHFKIFGRGFRVVEFGCDGRRLVERVAEFLIEVEGGIFRLGLLRVKKKKVEKVKKRELAIEGNHGALGCVAA